MKFRIDGSTFKFRSISSDHDTLIQRKDVIWSFDRGELVLNLVELNGQQLDVSLMKSYSPAKYQEFLERGCLVGKKLFVNTSLAYDLSFFLSVGYETSTQGDNIWIGYKNLEF